MFHVTSAERESRVCLSWIGHKDTQTHRHSWQFSSVCLIIHPSIHPSINYLSYWGNNLSRDPQTWFISPKGSWKRALRRLQATYFQQALGLTWALIHVGHVPNTSLQGRNAEAILAAQTTSLTVMGFVFSVWVLFAFNFLSCILGLFIFNLI